MACLAKSPAFAVSSKSGDKLPHSKFRACSTLKESFGRLPGQAVTPIQLRISGSGTIILCFGDAVATKLWLTYYRSERMLRIDRRELATQQPRAASKCRHRNDESNAEFC